MHRRERQMRSGDGGEDERQRDRHVVLADEVERLDQAFKARERGFSHRLGRAVWHGLEGDAARIWVSA